MARRLCLAVLALLACLVQADFKVTRPETGESYAASDSFKITWKDDGEYPKLSEMSMTTLLLCTGSNDDPTILSTLQDQIDPSDDGVTVSISSGLGGQSSRAVYFLRFYSVMTTGGIAVTYSGRFRLTGMTGSFAADVSSENADASGTPSGSTPATTQAAAATGAAYTGTAFVSGSALSAYLSQTGRTHSAPMQPVPGTTVTADLSSPQRLFPTSSYSIFTTYGATPYAVTTLTPSRVFTGTSMPNDAATADGPTGTYSDSKRRRMKRGDGSREQVWNDEDELVRIKMRARGSQR